jgi:hypothetical protein
VPWVLIGFLAVLVTVGALFFVASARGRALSKRVECANNLSQLWKLQSLYASRFGGRTKSMPERPGGEFWLELSRTKPPLADSPDHFRCPVRGSHATCDYLGPAGRVNSLADGVPVGSDQPGNHGAGAGGNVLRTSGDVVDYPEQEFRQLTQTLKP